MKENFKKWIIGIIIVLILIIPIIISNINSNNIKEKKFSDFYDNISETDFSVVYFGSTEKKDYEDNKKVLIEMQKEFTSIDIYAVDNQKLTEEEKTKLVELNSEFKNENVFTIISDKELVYVNSNKITDTELKKQINKYYNNIIPEDEIAYKTVSTYKAYMKLVNSKNITMAVFGRNTCSWCNKYKPLYNDVAREYGIDIYYFDSDSFNSTEYNKILNSGLKIPAKCSTKGKETLLSDGFGTPLTIFTKDGKTVDCIGGYVNKTNLINKLEEVGIINN